MPAVEIADAIVAEDFVSVGAFVLETVELPVGVVEDDFVGSLLEAAD